MKTYHLKDLLKKEIMLIELPENGNTFDDLTFLDSETKGYTLLGTPDEIKESDVLDLVHLLGDKSYTWANYEKQFYGFETALESFNSALESEIYWENPLNNKLDKSKPLIIQTEHLNKWKEAEQKTFEKSRTLIFVKI